VRKDEWDGTKMKEKEKKRETAEKENARSTLFSVRQSRKMIRDMSRLKFQVDSAACDHVWRDFPIRSSNHAHSLFALTTTDDVVCR
jgi:hypothetical protein